jgi:hypothetical protein
MARRKMLTIINIIINYKSQWLQDLSEINGDNLNNVRVKPADISGIKRGNI